MMFSRDATYLDPPEADECDCSLCRTGIGDGYGHDDGPKDCRCDWTAEDDADEYWRQRGEDI